MDFAEFEAIAHRLADAAAAETLPRFRTEMAVENKAGAGFDPVTEGDRAAEGAIRAVLERDCPDHGFVGEETGSVPGAGRYEWVVDPIDGTRSFVGGVPLWTTILGLRESGVPAFGMIDQPYVGDRFWGGAGKARLADRRGGTRDIRTRACERLADATLMTTTPKMMADGPEREAYDLVENTVRLARYGCDAYAYCLVATGGVDLVIEAGLQPYDIVGLVPLIEAAGGIVTTWEGGSPNEGGFIVAAGDRRVHEEALKLLAR